MNAVIGVHLLAFLALWGAGPVAPCDGPDVDPWVAGQRDRFVASNALVSFATERYGEPTACDGSVTTEFDGNKYGVVQLTFGPEVTLSVETMPPSVSITELRSADGLGDRAELQELLRRYAAEIGLEVDWATPEIEVDGDTRIERFWDPTPGLNASASLEYSGDLLVAIRLSLAP